MARQDRDDSKDKSRNHARNHARHRIDSNITSAHLIGTLDMIIKQLVMPRNNTTDSVGSVGVNAPTVSRQKRKNGPCPRIRNNHKHRLWERTGAAMEIVADAML